MESQLKITFPPKVEQCEVVSEFLTHRGDTCLQSRSSSLLGDPPRPLGAWRTLADLPLLIFLILPHALSSPVGCVGRADVPLSEDPRPPPGMVRADLSLSPLLRMPYFFFWKSCSLDLIFFLSYFSSFVYFTSWEIYWPPFTDMYITVFIICFYNCNFFSATFNSVSVGFPIEWKIRVSDQPVQVRHSSYSEDLRLPGLS